MSFVNAGCGQRSGGIDDGDAFGVGDAEFEQFAIVKQFGLYRFFAVRGIGFASILEIRLNQDVEGYRVFAKTQLVQGNGVVKQGAILAAILADEGIRQAECQSIEEFGCGDKFRNGFGEPIGMGFEAERVIEGTKAETQQMSDDSSLIMIQSGGHADDLGNLLSDESAEVGSAADALALFIEFQFVKERSPEQWVFIIFGSVPTDFGSRQALDT